MGENSRSFGTRSSARIIFSEPIIQWHYTDIFIFYINKFVSTSSKFEQVKPVLGRLKNTLLVLGVSLYICIVFLFDIESGQKYANIASEESGGRAIPGVYNEESARSFEPDAFCGESSTPWMWCVFCNQIVWMKTSLYSFVHVISWDIYMCKLVWKHWFSRKVSD